MQATAISTPKLATFGDHSALRFLLCGAAFLARIAFGAISCCAIKRLSAHNSRDFVLCESERVDTYVANQAGESKAFQIASPTDVKWPARTVLNARYRANQEAAV